MTALLDRLRHSARSPGLSVHIVEGPSNRRLKLDRAAAVRQRAADYCHSANPRANAAFIRQTHYAYAYNHGNRQNVTLWGSGPSAPGGGSGTPCHSGAFGMVWTSSLRSSLRGRGAIAEAEDIGRRLASRPKSMWKYRSAGSVAMAAAGIQQLAVYTARRIVSDILNERKERSLSDADELLRLRFRPGAPVPQRRRMGTPRLCADIHSASLLQTKMAPGNVPGGFSSSERLGFRCTAVRLLLALMDIGRYPPDVRYRAWRTLAGIYEYTPRTMIRSD